MARRHELAGARGGRETLRKHGFRHFVELGKKGIRATADKYFSGSVEEAMSWLRKRNTESQIDRGIDAQLSARLAEGEEIASVELPIICEPDSDPYWRDRVTASMRAREAELPW